MAVVSVESPLDQEPTPLAMPPAWQPLPVAQPIPDNAGSALRSCWEVLIPLLRAVDPRLQALVREGVPLHWEGQTLVIGFTVKYDFHRTRLQSDELLHSLLESTLANLVEHPVKVRCISVLG